MKNINKRYNVLHELSSDSLGTQYLVQDLALGKKKIALKIIHPQHSNTDYTQFFTDEFLALASIQHINIQQDYRFDIIKTIDNRTVDAPLYFYTSEYVDVKEAISYLTLDHNGIMKVMMELCYIINYLHFRDVIYKYLSFDTFWIFQVDGEYKIKLKSMATMVGYSEADKGNAAQLTQFVAPEIRKGSAFDANVDIYSLGVVAYYLVNQKPFKDGDIQSQYNRYANNPILNDLIKRAISYDASERYPGIEAYLEDFNKVCPYGYTFIDKQYYQRLNFNTKLVGRERILTEIMTHVEGRIHAMSGVHTAWVTGNPGMGKSRLLREVYYRARLSNINAFVYEGQLDLAATYGCFSVLILEMAKLLAPTDELILKYGPELVKVVPEMKAFWKLEASPALKQDREQLKINNRIVNFISDYALLHPTILIIDNIGVLSDNEKSILDNLLTIDRDLPLFLLYSFDQEDELGQQRMALWENTPKTKHYPLDNFDIHEASEHIKNVLSMRHTPTRLASYIVSETYGNPRYVEEVIKNLFLNEYIYVHDRRKWYITQDDLTTIALPESMDMALEESYNNVNDDCKKILEAIAIYNKPVSKSVILSMTHQAEEIVAEALHKLIELKILGIKYSDWGFTYDFYNKALGRLIVHNMSAEYRLVLHRCASDIVEAFYLADGTNGDSLIYHLENAEIFDKAVPYAIEMAEKMRELNIYSQAVEFYQKAMNLMTTLEDRVLLCRIEKAIAEIYVYTGEIDQALVLFYEVMDLAEENGVLVDLVDAIHQIIQIKLIKRDDFQYDTLLDLALAKSKQAEYVEGVLENGLLRSKIALTTGDMKAVDELVEEYLKLSFRYQSDYYIGRMLNQKGMAAGLREFYDAAFRSYMDAIKYLERGKVPSEASRPLNNLGVITLNAIGDIKNARDYFVKAVEATERYNVVSGKDFYLCNLGETYILEDNLTTAIDKIGEAEKLAIESDNKEIKFQIYYNLGLAHLTLYNFKEASKYLRKIEQEYLVMQERIADIGFDNYYLLGYDYALKCRDFTMARSFNSNLDKSHFQFADSYSQFYLKLLKFYEHHIHHEQWQNGYLDLDHLRVLKSVTSSPVEEKMMRVVLVEMMMDMLSNGLDVEAGKLYLFYEGLDKSLSTERLDVLDAAIGCLHAQDRGHYIEKLLKQYRLEIGQDILWRLFLILGSVYDQQGDYYNALLNYLNSLDALKAILLQMPEENRLTFLTEDFSKIRLRQRIDQLVHSIYDDQPYVETQYLVNYYEDFFSVDHLARIFNNEIFLASVKKAYQKRFDLSMDSAEDLFQHFKTDQKSNIELLLKYQMQLCLAEQACLYLVDEAGKVVETITPTPEHSVPDLKSLLKNQTVGGDGTVTSNSDKVANIADHRDALIFMPIFREEEDHPDQSRRRFDPISTKQVMIGYLYFHTDKLLNNFTEKAYADIEGLRNLLVVLIDNYDLKKSSSIDKLTGVYQRRFIEHQFKKLLVESSRNQSMMSIVMADIDHFKNVNDLYGHRKGDDILQRIGDILKTHVRKGDLVGRYGGEEFILLLPKTGEMDAYNVCEKLRGIIAERKLLGDDQTLTLSFGVSNYPLHGTVEAELIEKADKALYESKNNGRNQTTLWSQNLIFNNQRYDKLAGILTGSLSNDARLVKSIVDIIASVTNTKPKREKMQDILSIIVDIVEALAVSVIIEKDGEIKQVYTRKKGIDQLLLDVPYNQELYNRFKGSVNGDFFIHWNDTEAIDPILKTPDWKSYCVVPIMNGDKRQGMIIAMVSISEKEFDFNDFNFIQTISGLLSKL